MGRPAQPKSVKLILGFIFKEDIYFNRAKAKFMRYFGEIDFESQEIAFTHTDYYEKEFGSSLKRKFLSFKKLIPPDKLSQIKNLTNHIEKKLSCNLKRTVNIDPGYLDLSKLILATTKDFSHRIYLSKGIYAETTLIFKDKSFQVLPWTYPDYRASEYIEIFNRIRENYRSQL